MSSTKYLNKELSLFEIGVDYKSLISKIRQLSNATTSQQPSINNEWFELLDKVIDQLKSSSSSFAFRKPVRKFEAPDYHLVITHPMDLSTITKKIKQRQYKHKQQFKSDLDLIWTNCLVYNTDPNHPLRSHAIHLETKSSQLLEFIPDSPNSLLQDDDVGAGRSLTPSQPLHKRPHKKRKLDSNAVIRSVSPTHSPTPFPTTTLSNPFSDSMAILRGNDMRHIDQDEIEQPWQLFFTQEEDSANQDNTSTPKTCSLLIDSPSYKESVRNGMPCAPPSHTYSTPFVIPPHMPSSLQSSFSTQLSLLTSLNKSCDKESDDMDIDGSGSEGGEGGDKGEGESDSDSYKWGSSMLDPLSSQPGTLDDNVAGSVLHKVAVATVLHTGFTSSTTTPVSLLTHLLHTYLAKLCDTLKHTCEFYAHSLSPHQLIGHALSLNGSSVDALEHFMIHSLGDSYTSRLRNSVDQGEFDGSGEESEVEGGEDGDGDGEAEADGDGNADGDANANVDANADANADTNANANADANTEE